MGFWNNKGAKADQESKEIYPDEPKIEQAEETGETLEDIGAEVARGEEERELKTGEEIIKPEAGWQQSKIDEVTEEITLEQTEKENKKSDKEKKGVPISVDVEIIINQMADAIQRELYENIGNMMSGLSEKVNALHKGVFTLSENQRQLFLNQEDTKKNVKFLNDNLVNVVEQQEVTIQKQHNAALMFQEDVIYKIQKNLIMELINISDHIRMILQDQAQQPDYDLTEAVKGLNKWVDASLENNSIRRFQDTEVNNMVLDRKRQEVIDREATDDESKDGMYVSELPGYVWSLPYLVVNSDVQLEKILNENQVPKMFSYVIRPEQVIHLKYDKKNETNG